jgi:hypothetical protein
MIIFVGSPASCFASTFVAAKHTRRCDPLASKHFSFPLANQPKNPLFLLIE